MKTIFKTLAGAALACSIAAVPAQAETRAEKGQKELAKMLEGRVAGQPVSCINQNRTDRLKVIDQTAIVYDAGKTIYVARPSDPRSLDDNDILVINRFGSQLCTNDMIRTVDRSAGFMTGVVFLDDFVPYTKAD